MVKEKENEAVATAPIKKRGRGVSNTTKAVSQLVFNEKDAHPTLQLFSGHLVSVEVSYSTNENAKVFVGKSVPRLTFHFASNHANINEQRHYYHSLFPVPSNTNTIVNGTEAWKVDNILKFAKHMLDVLYLKGRELTEAEEDALTLGFQDSDENGLYVQVEEDVVIASYATLFKNVAAMLNGEFAELADGEIAKPVYRNANGIPVKIWMKLLRCRKRKNAWTNLGQNGTLAFDNFIGAGVIELIKENTMPSILRVDLSQESITPKEVNKKPSIGSPMAAMGGVTMAGMPGIDGMPSDDYNAAAGEAMPF